MQLRVVTKSGRTVSGVSVGETFPNTTDTCNNSTVSPSGCGPTDGGGTFQDVSTVGCPFTDSTCGFTTTDRWQWCTSGAPVPIVTLKKNNRPYDITINNNNTTLKGHALFR
jgi:hypothetical protein